jgi:hypothetical protein
MRMGRYTWLNCYFCKLISWKELNKQVKLGIFEKVCPTEDLELDYVTTLYAFR